MTCRHRDPQFWKTDGNKTCFIFIRHSSWKMKSVDKFCMIVLSQIEDPWSVLKIGSREHTTNDLPTFLPQKRNLEIGSSERLLPIFGTKNRILKIGSCERAFTYSSHLLHCWEISTKNQWTTWIFMQTWTQATERPITNKQNFPKARNTDQPLSVITYNPGPDLPNLNNVIKMCYPILTNMVHRTS